MVSLISKLRYILFHVLLLHPSMMSLLWVLILFKYCLVFIMLFGTFVLVVVFCNSISLSKGMILIVSSNCSSISTILASFYWRFSIAFFVAGSFVDINTYVTFPFSLLFLGGVTLTNTTSGSMPVFVPGLNTILSSSLSFFRVPFSGLPPISGFLV